MTEIMTREKGDIQKQLTTFHVVIYYEKRSI